MLSIIICTYNRDYIVHECLDSLCEQDISLDDISVIIIDNNSNDNTQEVLSRFRHSFKSIKVYFEPRQGLAFARNRGLAESGTEWVAFLDDDAKASSDWARTIVETIAKGDFDVFGGPFLAWHRYGPPPRWLPEGYDSYLGARSYGPLGGYFIPGGNCAFKKSLAIEAGGFCESLGMVGNKCSYGEETFLFNRMEAAGYRLGFVPAMRIEHCVLPYKYSLRWRLRAAYASGRDDPRVSVDMLTPWIFCWTGISFLKNIILMPIRLGGTCKTGFFWQKAILDCCTPVLSCMGRLMSLYGRLLKKTSSS